MSIFYNALLLLTIKLTMIDAMLFIINMFYDDG